MNCANHPDIAAMAYCRTCGKPLCANCTRDVKGVIYCENCLADRLQGVQPAVLPPAAGFVSSASAPIVPGGGPNPAVAGILAGFFPFGVGAVYCGQYAKGLAHLVIFTLLVWGESVVENDGLHVILAFGIAFFYVWQIIDSVRTAHAIQAGQPAPDPFGLAQAFGAAGPRQSVQPPEKLEAPRIPAAAVVLIGLGIVFLLHTAGIFELNDNLILPMILIGLGGWLFARQRGLIGSRRVNRRGRTPSPMGPAVLVTLGVQFLLHSLHLISFERTLPALLVVIGLVMILQRSRAISASGDGQPPMPPGTGPTGVKNGDVQAPTSEVRNG
ncbi:MAG TPA: B-box zinc finger protein [Terriglobales bacterium]|nr:B-box zinc finger protein [Terriglobales bacterium]